MPKLEEQNSGTDFLKSLGFPTLDVHETFTHFDFTTPGRRVLLIGPMGAGKTEKAAGIWRDAAVALKKSDAVSALTSTGIADRRRVFFIRYAADSVRFQDYPDDVLPYRSGYVRCGSNIAKISDSFGLEQVIKDNPDVGTYIIDEASFFDERIAYVARNYSIERGCMFVFPTLMLNFRKEFFNSTARLILDMATDVIPLTAYCEHRDCLSPAFYTYRYYSVDGRECPALYFDPLIIIGGDKQKNSALAPDYAARCDRHHYLPGKEYTFFTLKPLGEEAGKGNLEGLIRELGLLKENPQASLLCRSLEKSYEKDPDRDIYMNAMLPSHLAEKAAAYLFCEQNMIGESLLVKLSYDLGLDSSYLEKTLMENRHPVSFSQGYLL